MVSEFNVQNRNLSKLIFASLAALAVIVFALDTVKFISPGNVGVLIRRNGGGVDPTPLGVGFHMKWPIIQEIVEYPVYMQTLILAKAETEGSRHNEEINVNSVEG